MKDFVVETLEKHANTDAYEPVEPGIYRHLSQDDYSVALTFTTEKGEGQYPLEDLLDEFFVHVSDFITDPEKLEEAGNRITLELSGDLDDVQKVAQLVGKTVRNEEVEVDGNAVVRLVIEDA